jgi:hypothetical protein
MKRRRPWSDAILTDVERACGFRYVGRLLSDYKKGAATAGTCRFSTSLQEAVNDWSEAA